MVKLVLTKLGLKRLEPYDGKLSSTVLRGRRRWQLLLCYPTLMLMLFCSNVFAASSGQEGLEDSGLRFKFKQEDIDFAKDLRKRTMQMNIPQLKEKYYELQDMLGATSSNANTAYDIGDLDTNISLKIFVSSSMSKNLLKSYAKSARKYNATLMFQGLPSGSWRKLSDLVYEISEGDDENIAIQIDDEAFNQYGVIVVPAIILAKEEEALSENPRITFDKVTGSIGIRKALELFCERGQLSDIASNILDVSGSSNE